MDVTAIVAIITAVGSLTGTLSGILISNKLTIYRIQKLEEKVDKHNNVIERTFKLEGNCELLQSEIDNLKEQVAK